MLSILRAYWTQARAQAELLGQCGDQSFVNIVCHHDPAVRFIHQMGNAAYFRKSKEAPFLIVCGLLSQALHRADLDDSAKERCAGYLQARLQRAGLHPTVFNSHAVLLGEISEDMHDWLRRGIQDAM